MPAAAAAKYEQTASSQPATSEIRAVAGKRAHDELAMESAANGKYRHSTMPSWFRSAVGARHQIAGADAEPDDLSAIAQPAVMRPGARVDHMRTDMKAWLQLELKSPGSAGTRESPASGMRRFWRCCSGQALGVIPEAFDMPARRAGDRRRRFALRASAGLQQSPATRAELEERCLSRWCADNGNESPLRLQRRCSLRGAGSFPVMDGKPGQLR